jgi:hypothetical protein
MTSRYNALPESLAAKCRRYGLTLHSSGGIVILTLKQVINIVLIKL